MVLDAIRHIKAAGRPLESVEGYPEVARKDADLIVYVRTKQNFRDLNLAAASFVSSRRVTE